MLLKSANQILKVFFMLKIDMNTSDFSIVCCFLISTWNSVFDVIENLFYQWHYLYNSSTERVASH